ncbi:hypothetical protein M0R45_035776 [Rubus argutus]|uniref:Uncharacterized protein n=1 Tax=Rubus argutus TaxID=59490 RepID=A0AAW1VV73_RUBAR
MAPSKSVPDLSKKKDKKLKPKKTKSMKSTSSSEASHSKSHTTGKKRKSKKVDDQPTGGLKLLKRHMVTMPGISKRTDDGLVEEPVNHVDGKSVKKVLEDMEQNLLRNRKGSKTVRQKVDKTIFKPQHENEVMKMAKKANSNVEEKVVVDELEGDQEKENGKKVQNQTVYKSMRR